MTQPASQRVLDHEDYNNFAITCSAFATAGSSRLPLTFVLWERKIGSGSFDPLPDSDYTSLSGDPETGYTSQISRTESTPSSMQFRCTVALEESSMFSDSDTADVTVLGESSLTTTSSPQFLSLSLLCFSCFSFLPYFFLLFSFPVSFSSSGPAPPYAFDPRSTDVTDTTAIISWTVDSIAYTPETYVVIYGTSREMLGKTSSQQRSTGPDISASSLSVTLPLSGLMPETAYHYTVNASNSYSSTLYDIQTFTTTPRGCILCDQYPLAHMCSRGHFRSVCVFVSQQLTS